MEMGMQSYMKLCFWALMFSAIILSGCSAYNPMPIAARAGDTITLGVGSPSGMTAANTSVVFYPDAPEAEDVDLTSNIRSVFKIYPDPTSHTVSNNTGFYWTQLHHGVGHQPWMNVIAIDLPSTGLPEGTGVIRVTTDAIYPPPGNGPIDINDVSIDFEVLPGQGQNHPLKYDYNFTANLKTLEPSHQIKIEPNYTIGLEGADYGAIELELQFETGELPAEFHLISEDVTQKTGSMRNVIWSVEDDTLLVMYISPVGTLQYYEPRFSIIPLPAQPLSDDVPNTMPSTVPELTSVRYYNVDGDIISGPLETDYTITME